MLRQLAGLSLAIVLSAIPTFAEPEYLNGDERDTRTVCGKDDMEKMIDLDAETQSMGLPIGNLRGGGLSCTGTMISKDIFLTARHCNVGCSAMKVTFGYLSRDKETFPCKEILALGNSSSDQDFMALRLDGMPGAKWGWYDISDKPVADRTPLLMIHHPKGTPMKVTRKNCAFMGEKGGLIRHNCDSNPGSSGSAVIMPDYEKPENSRVIAVHTLGGCNTGESNYNKGPSIKHITGLSALLRSMVK